MNLAQSFSAARPVAQHCPQLLREGPRPEERAQHLASWRRDITRELAQDLGELLSGAKLKAALTEPEMLKGEDILERIGPIAANSLLRCGSRDHTLLLSFDFATAIALTDRSFGGDGEVELDQPEVLPRSAGLLVEQAARVIARAIARVSAGGGAAGEFAGDVIVRSESARRLKPFEPDADCALLTLELTEDDPDAIALLPWSARIALRADRLDGLLPGLGAPSGSPRAGGSDCGDPASGAFAHIPLPLEAVLAEFDMALGKLDRLKPGDQIPFAMSREIPLRIGSQTIARGSVGTLEDRIALRLTSCPEKGAAL